MPRQRRNTLSDMSAYSNIGNVGFNPVVFNPTVFEPKENDMTLLANAMARNEERTNKAYEAYKDTNNSLGKINALLSTDDETKQWFDAESKRITDAVNQSIQMGDYGKAMRDSSKLVSEFMNSRELKDRMTSNAEYQQNFTYVKSLLQNNKISRDTYDWWTEKYKYSFDRNTGTYKKIELPADDVSYDMLAERAYALLKPDVTSTTRGHTFQYTKPGTADKSVTNPNGFSTKGGGSQRTTATTEITEQEILDNIGNLINSIPDGYRRVTQDYEVKKRAYEKLKRQRDEVQAAVDRGQGDAEELKNLNQQIEQQDSMWMQNGSFVDWKTYFAKQITQNAFAKGLAHRTYTSSFTDSDIYSVPEHTSGVNGSVRRGANGNLEQFNPDTGSWESVNLQDEDAVGNMLKLLNSAGAGIIDLYENNGPQQ